MTPVLSVAAALDVATALCVAAGVFLYVVAAAGVARFPDALTRLHALAAADSLGLGFIALGLAVQMDGPIEALKLGLVWLLAQLGGATVGRLLAHRPNDREPAP